MPRNRREARANGRRAHERYSVEQAPKEQGGGHQLDTDRDANQVVQDREEEVHGATSSRLCASTANSVRTAADAGIGSGDPSPSVHPDFYDPAREVSAA